MLKKLLTTIFFVSITLVLLPACAKKDVSTATTANAVNATDKQTPVSTIDTRKPGTVRGQVSVMDVPVDFSTPENVEKSIEIVKLEAGDAKAKALTTAMKYLLTYDLALGHDKEKLYKKLNGKTPNAIIAMIER